MLASQSYYRIQCCTTALSKRYRRTQRVATNCVAANYVAANQRDRNTVLCSCQSAR